MLLPQQLSWEVARTKWKAILDGLLSNPSLDSSLLPGVSLKIGSNVINHKLGRKLQGWRIVGINAASSVYDSQSSNQTPELTLILVSSAAATVNLEVF